MLGAALVILGGAAAVVGVRLATERARPVDLVGAILAPLGLCLAFVGVGRLLAPGFLSGSAPERARSPVRVMPAGDSITQGSYGAGKNGIGGYRAPLWRRLQRGQYQVDLVGAAATGPFTIDRDHEGWNGVPIGELARRLERDLDAHPPDVVLLHIGTNDLIAGATAEVIEGRLASLIDLIAERAPRARLPVATLIGARVPNDYAVVPERVAEVNGRIRRLIADRASQGRRVQLVDMQARAVRAPDAFHDDGLHPNDQGYDQMAEVWFEALRPLLRRR